MLHSCNYRLFPLVNQTEIRLLRSVLAIESQGKVCPESVQRGPVLDISEANIYCSVLRNIASSSSAVDQLRPSVHMLPEIGWCGTGLPPFPTACWWLTHPAAITGVSVSARWDSPGGCGGSSVPFLCNRRVQSP